MEVVEALDFNPSCNEEDRGLKLGRVAAPGPR